MKISIITTTYNSSSVIQSCINSVHSQSYSDKEYIIIDGQSSDNTVDIIKENSDKINFWSSENDNGIYDAINKGIAKASGDIIGLLHSDDTFANENVLTKVAEVFDKEDCDSVYSDLVYVKEMNRNQRTVISEEIENSSKINNHSIIRYWKAHSKIIDSGSSSGMTNSSHYSLITNHLLLNGWMPPHPTLFIKKEIFDKYGLYRPDMKIAADYEMILRLFWKHKITSHYLPITTYCMTIGGASNKSLRNIITKSSEDYRAIKMHNLPFPLKTLVLKNLSKIPQFFHNK